MYKVWSLAASSFQQALLLDADNLPLVNPEGAPASNVSGSLTVGQRLRSNQSRQHGRMCVWVCMWVSLLTGHSRWR